MNLIDMFLLLLLISVILIVAVKQTTLKHATSAKWPFYAKKPLSTPEQVLYFRLKKALPEYEVLAQVQLSRFLGVKKGNNYQSWLNRINRMSADFVICRKDFSVVAVIELDDSSHQRSDRQIADHKKDKALASAEIKIVRWNVKSMPDVTTIQLESQKWKKAEVAKQGGSSFVALHSSPPPQQP
jgi:phage anti-repressor protein